MQKGHVFVFSVFLWFYFLLSVFVSSVNSVSKRAWRAPCLCSRDAVTTLPVRPRLVLWGVSCRCSCVVSLCGCSPPSENCSMSTARAETAPQLQTPTNPRRCEYVVGLILHSALTVCPLSVWLVAGVSSWNSFPLCPARRNASPFVFFPGCDWVTVALERQYELCNMLPYMNTCSCVLHAPERLCFAGLLVLRGFFSMCRVRVEGRESERMSQLFSSTPMHDLLLFM